MCRRQKAPPEEFPVIGKVLPPPRGMPAPFFRAYGTGDWGVVWSHRVCFAMVGVGVVVKRRRKEKRVRLSIFAVWFLMGCGITVECLVVVVVIMNGIR